MSAPQPAPHPSVAYKVLTASQYREFREAGTFEGAPVDLADGFIHLSRGDQLTVTVDKHFAGQSGLWVLAVELAALGDAVRWEPSRGGDLFPHIYAPLPASAVLAAGPLERDAGGAVTLPAP